MIKICPKTGLEFELTDDDLKFFNRMKVPVPEYHPSWRMRLLTLFRNERTLYKSKCAYSGQSILSLYPPDTNYKVYEQKVWWSDKWDPMIFGRDFNFEGSFFEQFEELSLQVPRVNLDNKRNENSEYCNDTDKLKDCYLCFNSVESQDCYYSTTSGYSKDCMDMFWSMMCELCYECTKVMQGYHSFWCFNCSNISDCYFCEESIGLKNCFGCVGLRHREYCVYNEQFTKERYEAFLKDFEFSEENIKGAKEKLAEFKLEIPHKNLEIFQSEDCVGDFISNSKNCIDCFDVMDSENCKYVWDGMVDYAYDCFNVGGDEQQGKCSFVYCSLATYYSNNMKFCNTCMNSADLIYCWDCFHCDSCFGCVGLKHKKYCILNKQYSKQEYEDLSLRIIEYMRTTGEWGRFFPARMSPFDYKDTVANFYFPSEALEVFSQSNSMSENVRVCVEDGRLFKLIEQEKKFYERFKLPIPQKCPNCRYFERKRKFNPRKLWNRTCSTCGVDLKSTYFSNRQEIVECEKCYLSH